MKTKDKVKKSESQELRTRLAGGLSDILYLPFVFIDIPGSFVQKRERRRATPGGLARLGMHRNAEVRSAPSCGLSDILYLSSVFIDIPGSFVQKREQPRDGLRRRGPRGGPPSETSRVARIYNNRGNEAKKSLKTKEVTRYCNAKCTQLRASNAHIEPKK
jgi:hypothetical protein